MQTMSKCTVCGETTSPPAMFLTVRLPNPWETKRGYVCKNCASKLGEGVFTITDAIARREIYDEALGSSSVWSRSDEEYEARKKTGLDWFRKHEKELVVNDHLFRFALHDAVLTSEPCPACRKPYRFDIRGMYGDFERQGKLRLTCRHVCDPDNSARGEWDRASKARDDGILTVSWSRAGAEVGSQFQPITSRFCVNCGAQTRPTRYCVRCGAAQA